MSARRLVVVDFDGTACLPDTGYLIAGRFGGPKWDELEDLWLRGKIGTRERATGQYALADITEPELVDLLAGAALDARFAEFLELARSVGAGVEVVSDGFDFIIKHVLDREGLGLLKYHANRLEFVDGRPKLSFPMEAEGCGRCGLCKAVPLRRARPHYDQIVFVGNGYSDACAAPLADVLFAKDSLAEHCARAGIAFRQFRDFGDVIEGLRAEWSETRQERVVK